MMDWTNLTFQKSTINNYSILFLYCIKWETISKKKVYFWYFQIYEKYFSQKFNNLFWSESIQAQYYLITFWFQFQGFMQQLNKKSLKLFLDCRGLIKIFCKD
eukprot:TRINITY_DN17922_c0_g1_i1.p4 TRINITY_DN17922_c0_g1~~TRINITY_DN17922_c0_g1_i1.p4  ORF type:complete len:102 (+),score=0.24 TRINITY_DN17922_c0_g1_i1:689-994(+)